MGVAGATGAGVGRGRATGQRAEPAWPESAGRRGRRATGAAGGPGPEPPERPEPPTRGAAVAGPAAALTDDAGATAPAPPLPLLVAPPTLAVCAVGLLALAAATACRRSPLPALALRRRLARDPASAQVGARVLRLPADARLEVQVRPGAVARAAHVADHLALTHLRSLARREPRQVRVARRELARVGDADDVSVAALLPGHAHRPARRSPDRRAGRRRQVHAVVVASAARPEGRALRPVHGRRDRRRAAARLLTGDPGLNCGAGVDCGAAGGLRSGRGLRPPTPGPPASHRAGLDQPLLDPVAHPLRHVRAAAPRTSRTACPRSPARRCRRPPAWRGPGRRAPPRRSAARTRRPGSRPSAFWTSATSGPCDPTISGSPPSRTSIARWDGVSAATAVWRSPDAQRGRRPGARPRHGRGDHRQRDALAPLLLAPQPRRQRAPAARSFERLLPEVSRSQVSLGERHPSCPLPLGPTGLADGLALEDALRGTASATRPERQMGPPFLASGRREDSALDLHYRNNPGEGKLRDHLASVGAEPAVRQSLA